MKRLLLVLILLTIPVLARAADTDYFQGLDGCFLLYNMKTAVLEKEIGKERCQERLPPASTFKLALSVMAFDAGILKDADQVLKWDGVNNEREVANHDHNARTWMRDSIVWFSQRLTPQLGSEKTKQYLHLLHYGNEDLDGGLTQAWLIKPDATTAALRISAYEQLDFMKALWSNQLPVSARAMQITQEISYLETSPKGFKLSGKTGSNFYEADPLKRLGWFLAHVDNGQQEYISVANFSDKTPSHENVYGGAKAKEITKRILSDQGLW